jgi:c-di-GMP-binding flagellar brake protein YcgR
MTEYGERSELEDRRASADNRRAAFRLPVALDVLAEVSPGTRGTQTWKRGHEGPCLRTVTEDLSVGGLRFRAPERLERGTGVELELDLDGTRVDLSSTVARTTVDSFGAAVGVQFTDAAGRSAQSSISRFLFTRERRRLPRVSVMYAVKFTADGTEGIIEGTTEECSPGFAWLLLTHAAEVGRRALVNVRVDKGELALSGRTVGSVKTEHLWRTGVEFDEIVPRWRDVIIERREGRR